MLDLLYTGIGIPSMDVLAATNRIILGVFFATSGYHKLFNAARHASLVETLTAAKVPYVGFNQWFVPTVEFAAGMALIVGLFSPLAAAGLFVICLVATLTDGIKRIPSWNPIDKGDWVCCFFYLPEVLYLMMLAFVISIGPSIYSLDALVIAYDIPRSYSILATATYMAIIVGIIMQNRLDNETIVVNS